MERRFRPRPLGATGLVGLWLAVGAACGAQEQTAPGGGGSGAAASGGSAGQGTGASGGGTPKANSLSCATSWQCLSGHCPAEDQVCCDAPCDGECEACLESKTGQPNGTCAPVLPATDPDGECPTPATCTGDRLCCGAQPTAPSGPCPQDCTGGCSAGVCLITCGLGGSCQDATLTCPAGFACQVECAGAQACEKTQVICAERYACVVHCGADDRCCRNVDVTCSTGPCDLSCADNTACQGATVHCGSNRCYVTCSAGSGAGALQCNDSCDCQSLPC